MWFSLINFNFSFFHFSDLQNLVNCMDSIFSCYSLLNMKVVWFYMVSAPLQLQWCDLIWKFAKTLWWKFFFLYLSQDKSLWVELNIWVSKIYYYITTLSLFYCFRNSQHPEKWSVSLKNFFRKCECSIFYLPISSNLQFQF